MRSGAGGSAIRLGLVVAALIVGGLGPGRGLPSGPHRAHARAQPQTPPQTQGPVQKQAEVQAGAQAAVQASTQDAVAFAGGTFRMGLPPSGVAAAKVRHGIDFPGIFQNEVPVRSVTVSPFRMDRWEVTNARFLRFVEAQPGWRPAGAQAGRAADDYLRHWTGGRVPPGLERHPVTFVTWGAAQAFCRWAGGRLPSEAEWEYAATDGDGREFPWGEAPPTPALANFAAAGLGSTATVGRYPPTGPGLYDLSGNVWEWTLDAWEERPGEEPVKDPVAGGPVDDAAAALVMGRRVIRGGSYAGSVVNLRTRWRDSHEVSNAVAFVGFRCVYPA